MKQDEDYIKQLMNPSFKLFYPPTSKQKCAVKVVSTGEHCPEIGIHQIDDTDNYLCGKCHDNWIQSNNNTSIKKYV